MFLEETVFNRSDVVNFLDEAMIDLNQNQDENLTDLGSFNLESTVSKSIISLLLAKYTASTLKSRDGKFFMFHLLTGQIRSR